MIDHAKIEKLVGSMTAVIAEMEEIFGKENNTRDSKKRLVEGLVLSYLLSVLERSETEYPGLGAELLTKIHEMTRHGSPLSQRIASIVKKQ